MRKTCLSLIYELAKKDDRVVFIGSDLGALTLQNFKEEMLDRFFMEGISEQNIIGIAVGLALNGKVVYVNTIAPFITRRCFEQVVLDVCLHNANVRLLGNGGGLVYASMGPTHEATDDIAILRTIPNMTIIAPADAEEMKRLMPQTLDYKGPIYIRFATGNDPIVSQPPFVIGKAIPIRKGKDALIITTGITLKMAIEASEILAKENIDVDILHVPTIKPLDREALYDHIHHKKIVLTIEEHSIIGGLGSVVAELIANDGYRPEIFRRIALPDIFIDRYGSQNSLLKYYGISAKEIVNVISKVF